MDPTVRQAGDGGVPVVVSHPDSKVAQAMVNISKKIAGNVSRFAVKAGDDIKLEIMD
jgi:MinD-like ATPase involved in chromosome partitioning or flagellar assembly